MHRLFFYGRRFNIVSLVGLGLVLCYNLLTSLRNGSIGKEKRPFYNRQEIRKFQTKSFSTGTSNLQTSTTFPGETSTTIVETLTTVTVVTTYKTSTETSTNYQLKDFTSAAFEEKLFQEQQSCPDFQQNISQNRASGTSEKFIGHVLSNGPNNQIVDFRHGIFWSIK